MLLERWSFWYPIILSSIVVFIMVWSAPVKGPYVELICLWALVASSSEWLIVVAVHLIHALIVWNLWPSFLVVDEFLAKCLNTLSSFIPVKVFNTRTFTKWDAVFSRAWLAVVWLQLATDTFQLLLHVHIYLQQISCLLKLELLLNHILLNYWLFHR